MAMNLPNGFVDDLMSRVDIVDVIDKRVPLRRAGREYTACCPFHSEKTPSFTVSPQKQFYHCFGCGAHGTAIGFLMQYERLGFIEAVRELAEQIGMSLPDQSQSKAYGGEAYPLLQQVAQFYHQQLLQAGGKVREFLSQRGISEQSAQRFQLGLAPALWSALADRFSNDAARQQLIKHGLLVYSDKHERIYDRFRDRLLFPIYDQRGRVIAFGGRALGEDKAKYLNSPETPLFHKGRELFNFDQARKHVDPEPMLVVEGYMDALMLVQFGFENVVASLGTAVTPVQLQRLFKSTPQLVMCFDGDPAGQRAAWRTLGQALPLMEKGRDIRVITLPSGDDPDSLLRRSGAEAMRACIEQSIPLSDFFFGHLLSQVDNLNEAGRARLVELAKPLLSKLPDGVYRRLMYDRLSKYAMVDAVVLVKTDTGTSGQSHAKPAPSGSRKISPLRTAVTLLLQRPSLAQHVRRQELVQLRQKGISFFLKIVDIFQRQPHLNCAALIEQWRDDADGRLLVELARLPIMIPDAGIAAEFDDALTRLYDALRRQRIDDLLAKAQVQSLDEQEQGQLQRLFREPQS